MRWYNSHVSTAKVKMSWKITVQTENVRKHSPCCQETNRGMSASWCEWTSNTPSEEHDVLSRWVETDEDIENGVSICGVECQNERDESQSVLTFTSVGGLERSFSLIQAFEQWKKEWCSFFSYISVAFNNDEPHHFTYSELYSLTWCDVAVSQWRLIFPVIV